MKINEHYKELEESYLFSHIAQKVEAYTAAHPQSTLIRLGIGDVTLPLAPCVIDALHKATSEMAEASTFHGYGDEQGYEFLRLALCGYYRAKGVSLVETEVFISDGAKSDLGNILDIFSDDNTVLIPDPVYPVYVDTNIMAGRKILYMEGTPDNGFLALPSPAVHADIIYLCSPNNPTGAVYTKEHLQAWVDYALEHEAVILFDSAYEAFVQDADIPTSIFEISGAQHCAIEFGSLSKTAGFTGMRCGYTIVPHELMRGGASLNKYWLRRQTTKFNGVSYSIQRAAEAVFTHEGLQQTRENILYYRENARLIAQKLDSLGIGYTGGRNSPYIWLRCPEGMTSWEYFDHLLEEYNIVGTPGSGFGKNGEGFFRLTAFGNRDDVVTAMQRL